MRLMHITEIFIHVITLELTCAPGRTLFLLFIQGEEQPHCQIAIGARASLQEGEWLNIVAQLNVVCVLYFMYIFTHTYLHICIHTYVCMYGIHTYICMHACMYVCIDQELLLETQPA